jgi:hypothetical protein
MERINNTISNYLKINTPRDYVVSQVKAEPRLISRCPWSIVLSPLSTIH